VTGTSSLDAPARAPRRPLEIAATIAVVTVTTVGAWLLFGRDSLPDVAMVYLLGIVAVAMRLTLPAAVLSAILSVLSFDFFFVPPYLSFRVDDARHIVTFGVMFIVGVVISTLTRRIRAQAEAARTREQRTARLYAMSRELSATRGVDQLGEVATRHLHALFDGDVILLVRGPGGELESGWAPAPALGAEDRRAAEWVWAHDRAAGAGTHRVPAARALFLPLLASQGRAGVLGVVPRAPDRFVDGEQRQLLETFAAQIAGALERARLASEGEAARLEAESERLRSSLLSSVSHDLRTPLAVITGAATTLLTTTVDGAAQRDLLAAICDESVRLTRLVSNLLDMTRLAAGAVAVRKEWQSVEAVVGAALGRVEDRLGGRALHVELPAALPLVPFDAVLIEQVLINLLENAAKYTPAGTPIEVRASADATTLVVEVGDRGPGVPEAERSRIFDRFYRLAGGPRSGAGLGLTICRAIVEAHGGHIQVDGREGGGARFLFTLPIEGSPPAVEEEGSLS